MTVEGDSLFHFTTANGKMNIYSNWPTYESDDIRVIVADADELLLWAARNTVKFLWQPGHVHTEAGIGPPLIQSPPA